MPKPYATVLAECRELLQTSDNSAIAIGRIALHHLVPDGHTNAIDDAPKVRDLAKDLGIALSTMYRWVRAASVAEAEKHPRPLRTLVALSQLPDAERSKLRKQIDDAAAGGEPWPVRKIEAHVRKLRNAEAPDDVHADAALTEPTSAEMGAILCAFRRGLVRRTTEEARRAYSLAVSATILVEGGVE
jgi:hypothetical protein